MLVITSDIKREIDSHVLETAVDVIKAGGVIAYATDTCYGFSCDSTNDEAVKRLRVVKNQSNDKPISLMFSDLEMVMNWVDLPKNAIEIAANYWPGQITIIAPKKNSGAFITYEKANTTFSSLGCRIPACVFTHKLVSTLKRPITTTSANISGFPQAYSSFDLIHQLIKTSEKPDLLIDSGVQPKVLPSTIVDVTGDEFRILRQGETLIKLLTGLKA